MRRRTFLGGLAAGSALPACYGGAEVLDPTPTASNPYSDPDIAPLVNAALEAAQAGGAEYADIRISSHRSQSLSSREERITRVSDSRDRGFGIRVLVDGTWGFAASADVNLDEVRQVAAQALGIAKANRRLQADPVRLAPVEVHVGRWETPIKRDAFEVPIEEKAKKLLEINKTALSVAGVSFVSSSMNFVREHKYFGSTEGTRVEQILHRCNPHFTVTSVNAKKGSFRSRESMCAPQGRGYDFIEEYDWLADAKQAAEDAVAMHDATSVRPGKWDLVLLPSHLWLTIHESIGHPTELDRALLYEANYAGTSFLTTDKMGKFKLGSDIVNFTAEKTAEGALATCKWDDDGVPTMSWPLVTDGVFVDYQTTRDQAHWIGHDRSYGCSYAQSWRDVAFQRMPNINLIPPASGPSLAELIADTKRGILIAGRGSYSIDHQRHNFQFGGQTFHEISEGKIVGLLTDVAYQANTADFWNACDAICGPTEYAVNGSFYDGKGEPGQSNGVSHGTSPARFRQIDVLNTGRRKA